MFSLDKSDSQKGNILVSSLLILIAMNLLAAGLMQSSTRELQSANYKSVDSEVFHIAETCTNDVINAFEVLTGTPSTSMDVSTTTPSYLSSGTSIEVNKLSGYSYDCTVTWQSTKTVSAGTGSGGDISGSGSEYGGTGGTVTKDYYIVQATGQGPSNSQKVINTLISVEY